MAQQQAQHDQKMAQAQDKHQLGLFQEQARQQAMTPQMGEPPDSAAAAMEGQAA